MLRETLQDKPTSKPWHPLLMLFLCVVGTLIVRFVIHHSLAALKNTLRDSPTQSAPSVHVGENAPIR